MKQHRISGNTFHYNKHSEQLMPLNLDACFEVGLLAFLVFKKMCICHVVQNRSTSNKLSPQSEHGPEHQPRQLEEEMTDVSLRNTMLLMCVTPLPFRCSSPGFLHVRRAWPQVVHHYNQPSLPPHSPCNVSQNLQVPQSIAIIMSVWPRAPHDLNDARSRFNECTT